MAPLPQSNTKRYFLDYDHSGIQHTILMRVSPGVTDAQAISRLTSLVNAVGNLCQACNVVQLRVAAAGSNVTNPVAWTGPATFGTGGAASLIARANFISWVGRAFSGRRVRLTLYGRAASVTDNLRITVAENAQVGTILGILRADTLSFQAIDNGVPVWQEYANAGLNAYWTRKVRTL